jgi:hypothetical protein
MWEAELRRVMIPGQPAQKVRPYLKINFSKKDWGCGSREALN